MQLNNMLMVQRFMNGYLRLQHFDVCSSKLPQINHFYRISLVGTQNLNTFVYVAAITFTELVAAIVLILSNSDLCIF